MINKKILITGSKGFLGRHLTKHFETLNFDVVGVDREECDLRKLDSVKKLFSFEKPDFLIHLAARVTPGRSVEDFDSQFQDTVLPAINIANSLNSEISLAAFVGSNEEYGTNNPPFTEDLAPKALSSYGWAKISAYYAVEFLMRESKLPYCWIRPSLMFGPGVSSNLFFGRVLEGCLKGEKIELTACEQKRDMVYVKDVCKHFQKIIENPSLARSQTINISSGRSHQLRTVAHLVQKSVGRGELLFGALPYRTNEMMDFYSSNEKFQKLFGKMELTDLEAAIRETVSEISRDASSNPKSR